MESYKIVVIGDVMLDKYIIGQNNRNSPEADIPILDVLRIEDKLGGASNVANNLKSMGMHPILFSIIGDDKAGRTISELLSKVKIENHLFINKERKTTAKTRLVDTNYKQFIRYDEEDIEPIFQSFCDSIIESLTKLVKENQISAIIIQDYNKGLCSKELVNKIQMICQTNKIKLLVDPKQDNFQDLSRCDVFKPNFNEIKSFLKKPKLEKDSESIMKNLIDHRLSSKRLFITLAESGVFYKDEKQFGIIPGIKIQNPDVSGAGDSVISVLAILEILDYNIKITAKIINQCGALVCQKQGVSTISQSELLKIINKTV